MERNKEGGLYIEESTVDICEMTMREGEISRKKERERKARVEDISCESNTEADVME